MSNLDPPRDPLEAWEQYGNIRIGARVPGGCDYVLATLTRTQAFDLTVRLVRTVSRETGGSIPFLERLIMMETGVLETPAGIEPPLLNKSGGSKPAR